jgi:hypothetical protein
MAGDFAVFADRCIFLDFNEGADLGIVTNGAAVEVDEVVNLDTFAKFYIWCDLFHNFKSFLSHRLTQTNTDFFLPFWLIELIDQK